MDFTTEFCTSIANSFNADQLRKIRAALDEFIADYDITPKSRELTICEDFTPVFYKTYIVSKKIQGTSDNTLEHYQLYLERFFRTVNKPIEKIGANDIRLFLYNEQEHGTSASTLDHVRVVIGSFFKWSYDEGYLPGNPCRNIGTIKGTVEPRKPLTEDELERIRSACQDTTETALIEFLYSTGCRVSETINVKLKDINFNDGTLTVLGKGKKYRTVYLNAKAKHAISLYLKGRNDPNDFLFIKRRGKTQYNARGIQKMIEKIGKRAQLDRQLFPHLIRHTTATMALDRGMPIEQVQKMLGHSKIDTTLVYAEVSQSNIQHSHSKYVI